VAIAGNSFTGMAFCGLPHVLWPSAPLFALSW
jgi:hypothetical protein